MPHVIDLNRDTNTSAAHDEGDTVNLASSNSPRTKDSRAIMMCTGIGKKEVVFLR